MSSGEIVISNKGASKPKKTAPIKPSTKPPSRSLRVYAFDPSLDLDIEKVTINQVVARVRWEENLEKGPKGEYIEVIDIDPASKVYYEPVDLNELGILAQQGCAPSEGNPQFHQQMVYAVAMVTIQNFESSLGRKTLWSGHYATNPNTGKKENFFVRQLRIYPHAIRQANAFYDPQKKALLFGYFPASKINPGNNLPGGLVFTCLSFDIISHETTHALLDGLNRRFSENTNPDALAFHEAFADAVALLQRFKFAEVLRHEIANTKGQLRQQNFLAKLAWQVGQAIGHYGSLRDALGKNDANGNWQEAKPDVRALENATEPHERGAVLVAAIFDAFTTIYEQRTKDLIRLASGGSGILNEGAIHPDLVNRLAEDAALVAGQVLNICIRALDYCPPVDLTFGEYLRAIITLDSDMVPEDLLGYRIAIIEAFRRRGIYPHNVRALSVDSLRWKSPDISDEQMDVLGKGLNVLEQLWIGRGQDISDYLFTKEKYGFYLNANEVEQLQRNLSAVLTTDREYIHTVSNIAKRYVHFEVEKILDDDKLEIRKLLGLVEGRRFEVSQACPARRVLLDGSVRAEMLVTFLQRLEVDLKTGKILPERTREQVASEPLDNVMVFRGGCTLVIDMDHRSIKYIIKKRIDNEERRNHQLNHKKSLIETMGLDATYNLGGEKETNPFAILHGEKI